ncbi:hypothetical protein ABZ356_23810 [Micromonospora zamorensis]
MNDQVHLSIAGRAWWSRLAPYPGWQVQWPTGRRLWAMLASLLSGLR